MLKLFFCKQASKSGTHYVWINTARVIIILFIWSWAMVDHDFNTFTLIMYWKQRDKTISTPCYLFLTCAVECLKKWQNKNYIANSLFTFTASTANGDFGDFSSFDNKTESNDDAFFADFQAAAPPQKQLVSKQNCEFCSCEAWCCGLAWLKHYFYLRRTPTCF